MSSSASSHTIGDEEWEYLQTLNMCIQLLLTTLFGVLLGYVKKMDANIFVSQSTTFVFYVALPCLVLNSLGIQIDFYSEKFLWDFIVAFLLLRLIALFVAIVIVTLDHRNEKGGMGQIAVLWLAMTWISTVILGVPIASAVFDDPTKGAKYGILAGISSFIFQLPFQLLFLECHLLEEEHLATNRSSSSNINSSAVLDDSAAGEEEEGGETAQKVTTLPPVEENPANAVQEEDPETALDHDENVNMNNNIMPRPKEEAVSGGGGGGVRRMRLWARLALRRDVWRKIFYKMLRNPVLWAITGGLVLTLSTLGPTYLNEKSDDFVPGLGFISETLNFIGNTVTPVSLFTMGVWMQSQGKHGGLFQLRPLTTIVCMVSKLILVPFIMVGLAKGLNLSDEPGRAAVLIAALPISMASFSLANRYGIGEAVMAENVTVGTLLILPTVIIWNIVMDELSLFPLPAK